MNNTDVHYLEFDSELPSLEEISDALDKKCIRNTINTVNWERFPYMPDVEFAIGYTSREFLIKYFITEWFFKAEKTESTENVFEDSCVELFILPDDSSTYFNFEFNGIGTCLAAAGSNRFNRTLLDKNVIKTIRRKGSAGGQPVAEVKMEYSWTIVAAIPFRIFFGNVRPDFKNLKMKANFYKCGDRLTVPHYLTWNPVNTGKPDFHRPEYFGTLRFIG